MGSNAKVYKKVFERDVISVTDFETFLLEPQKIMNALDAGSLNKAIGIIKRTKDKEYRNFLKRNKLPVIELYPIDVLAIDIDELLGDKDKIDPIVKILMEDPHCMAVKGTPSNNLVAFYKFKCSEEDFPYLYYKLYLELTLKLAVNIDFLPEVGRLRYLSNGKVYFYNKDSKPLTEILKVEKLPYIFKTKNAEMQEDEGDSEGDKSKGVKKSKRRAVRMIYTS